MNVFVFFLSTKVEYDPSSNRILVVHMLYTKLTTIPIHSSDLKILLNKTGFDCLDCTIYKIRIFQEFWYFGES